MKKKIAAYCSLIRLPELFVLPGDLLAGCLLAGGTGSGYPLLFAVAALLMTEISANTGTAVLHLKEDCLANPSAPLPSGTVSVIFALILCCMTGISGLILAVFSSVWTFLAVVLTLFLKVHGTRYHAESSALIRTALGISFVPSFYMPSLFIAAAWLTGVLLFLTGRRIALTDTAPVGKRPGRRLFMAGAVIAYGTLFGVVIRKPTQDWFSLTCGGVSALSAGVFLVLAYWAFRLFQYPVTRMQVAGTAALMSFGLIFLQAGTAAGMDALYWAFVLIAGAVCSRLLMKFMAGDK